MSTFNEWFSSLPKERQEVLREDRWVLANAAFEHAQAERDSLAAQEANLKNYIVAITHADETGYVDGLGFVKSFNEVESEVKAIVAAHDAEVIEAALDSCRHTFNYGQLPVSEIVDYVDRLRTKK